MAYQRYSYFLFTEDVEKLVRFYTDVLGFKVIKKLELPKDYGYTLEIAPGYKIWLANHSEIQGKNKDSLRVMLNIYVDSVKEVREKIENAPNVTIVQEVTAMNQFNPEETRYVLTILDPEGNCLQFMGNL